MQPAPVGDPRKEELLSLCRGLLSQRPLIVASNRGPLEYQLMPDGGLVPRRGSGAVVTAFNALTQSLGFVWVANAMGEGDRRVAAQAGGKPIPSPLPNQRVKVRFVVTPRRVYHKFYNIFCNPLLWFLQHYMWSAPYTPNIDGTVYDAWATGYEPVNQAFAEAIVEEARDSGTSPLVLLHDYHFYLAAGVVRQAMPDAFISHFIHVPWPAPQLWQLLPATMRSAICRSLCRADVVGFQAPWDAQNFLESCAAFLEGTQVDYAARKVVVGDRCTHVRVYPTSIDVDEMRRIAASPRTLEYERRTRPLCAEHTIVRVDRAEPSKNVLRSFRSYQILLDRHPELRRRITFLAFLVPSRTHVSQYERYLKEIDDLIRSINTAYGDQEWQPIQFFHENNYTQAMAGLRLYDTLLVNPVADGMSLVAKEGPVVNTRHGVLILSESTGAYPQLKAGALAVATADLEGTAEAMYQAVTMSPEERQRRAALLVEAVSREDATHWLMRQFKDLEALLADRPLAHTTAKPSLKSGLEAATFAEESPRSGSTASTP